MAISGADAAEDRKAARKWKRAPELDTHEAITALAKALEADAAQFAGLAALYPAGTVPNKEYAKHAARVLAALAEVGKACEKLTDTPLGVADFYDALQLAGDALVRQREAQA